MKDLLLCIARMPEWITSDMKEGGGFFSHMLISHKKILFADEQICYYGGQSYQRVACFHFCRKEAKAWTNIYLEDYLD